MSAKKGDVVIEGLGKVSKTFVSIWLSPVQACELKNEHVILLF